MASKAAKPTTKKARRRANLINEHWLKIHADPRQPRHRARMIRKHLGLR